MEFRSGIPIAEMTSETAVLTSRDLLANGASLQVETNRCPDRYVPARQCICEERYILGAEDRGESAR